MSSQDGALLRLAVGFAYVGVLSHFGDQDPAPDIPGAGAVSAVALQLGSGVHFCSEMFCCPCITYLGFIVEQSQST